MSINVMGNRYFWLLLLVFMAIFGLWVRGSLFGFDSYATLSAIRFGWFDTLHSQPVANMVWGMLPDLLFVFNLMMIGSIFFSLIPIWLLVKHFFDERKAWLSIFLLLGLAPVVLFGFGEFENEILAYPFIVWSIYFLLTKKRLYSLICACLGLLFWKWVYYFTFFNFGVSSGAVEQNMFAGLINFWLLLPFLFVIPFLKGKLKWFGLLALFGWLWNAKLFIFLLPFVGLSIAHALILLENTKNKHFLVRFIQNNWNYIYIIAFFCLVGWNIAFVMQSPTQNDWKLVNTTIQLSEDTNLPIFNDWSYGYWFWSKGIKVSNTPGNGKPVIYQGKGIYLTEKELPCKLITEKKELARKETKIWHCN